MIYRELKVNIPKNYGGMDIITLLRKKVLFKSSIPHLRFEIYKPFA